MKLRPQALAAAMSAPGSAAAPAASATVESRLQTLLTRHAIPSAAPLSPPHVRARQQAAGGRIQASAARPRFPARAARAPAGAVAPDLSTTYVLELANRSPAEIAAVLRELRADAGVLYAAEEKTVRAFYVPNDPSYASSDSWGQGYDDLHGLKRIGTTAAWDVTRGAGVVVAVIDSGVDYNHPDISANIWTNPGEIPGNGIDDDNNGFIDDFRGWDFVGANENTPVPDNDPYDGYFHGTHIAGTIAATGDNGLGVVGVAWQAKIMALKGLDDGGSGPDAEVAQAIIYATDNGADIINASWGGVGDSPVIADAIDYATAHGVVFVAAAGNNAIDVGTFFPANSPQVITVSALAANDTLAGFSNFGSKIDVAAPGEDILSLENGTAGYSRKSGTSMAAPHVSGVAALILAAHPTYSTEQVRQVLRGSATDLGAPGRDASFGNGRVNAAQAVMGGTAAMIGTHPVSRTVGVGQGTVFSVTASGTVTLAYQWERKAAGDTSWMSLVDGANYSGVLTATLNVTGVLLAMNGDQFRCQVSNLFGGATSNPGTLSVVPGFSGWLETMFTAGELLDANLSGPNADPDGDGLANLIEYALGLEPKTANSSGLPAGGVDGSDWTYTYTRPSDRPDVTYVVEASTNLSFWNSAGVTHELVSSSGGVETWEARYPMASATNCYFRLKVTR